MVRKKPAAKKPTKSDPKTWDKGRSAGVQTGWGTDTRVASAPSGVPVKLEPDSDCVLRFVAKKDITDQLKEAPRDDKPAIYLTFFDGLKTVSMSATFKLLKTEFKENLWYYIHHEGEIPTDLNPMADFFVVELGETGKTVQVPLRLADNQKLSLEDDKIAELNYSRLNYPLRP